MRIDNHGSSFLKWCLKDLYPPSRECYYGRVFHLRAATQRKNLVRHLAVFVSVLQLLHWDVEPSLLILMICMVRRLEEILFLMRCGSLGLWCWIVLAVVFAFLELHNYLLLNFWLKLSHFTQYSPILLHTLFLRLPLLPTALLLRAPLKPIPPLLRFSFARCGRIFIGFVQDLLLPCFSSSSNLAYLNFLIHNISVIFWQVVIW